MKGWLPIQEEQSLCWLADREFIGQAWFADLHQQGMQFVIRIHKNAQVRSGKQSVAVHKLFDTSSFRALRKPRLVNGQALYLASQRLADGDYLILVSNQRRAQVGALYAQRWQVESLFAAFKSRGFNLEGCWVNHARRLKTLLFVLAISLVWAVMTGQWLIQQGQRIPLKKFD